MRSIQVFCHRVCSITTGQAKNTGQDVKGSRQGSYSNIQAGKCVPLKKHQMTGP